MKLSLSVNYIIICQHNPNRLNRQTIGTNNRVQQVCRIHSYRILCWLSIPAYQTTPKFSSLKYNHLIRPYYFVAQGSAGQYFSSWWHDWGHLVVFGG